MKLSIRWGVIFGCILLVWGSQLIIMPVTFFSSRKVMLDHSRDIMENILDLTVEETRNYFSMARGAAHLTERLIASDIVNTENNSIDKLERYFCDQMALYPQFAGIYFATPDGRFYYVNREPDPGRGALRFKLITYDDGGRRTTLYRWRDENMNLLSRSTDPSDTYDPRERPWYKKAVREKGIIWTDPYVFFSSQKPGITTAGPLMDKAGNLRGVVGVDIELDVLSAFVGKLRVGKSGLAFIVNANTDMIAYPDLSRLLAVSGKNDRLPKLNELDNPLCKKAYDAVFAGEITPPSFYSKAFSSFRHRDEEYYTMFTRVRGQKISWLIGVYIPEEDYLGAIHANQRMTLLLTFGVSVLATIAGLVVAGRLIAPISALDREARKIKENDYADGGRIQSVFGEIQRTADSFFEMRSAVKAYKREIQHKDAIHRAITDTANEAIVMADEGGKICYWNPAAQTLFGYTAEEALGCHTWELTPFQDQYRHMDTTLFSLFRENTDIRDVRNMELAITQSSGRDVPAEISLVRIPIQGHTFAIAVFRDISDRKKSENEKLAIWTQLQQARKMEAIGTLAGGIAHDFNNILSGILGHAELLEVKVRENEAAVVHIRDIVSAGERARDLVRQILAFSFQETRKLVPLSMPDIVGEACSLMASSVPGNIRIERRIDPDCPTVMGDATQIHQVALNLMTNAFQAMEGEGGTLTVSLSAVRLTVEDAGIMPGMKPGRYLCYEVADTGAGIPAQTLDRIFDPYFTTKPAGKGTGLGLAVIKGIVQNHGGEILVESQLGQGSRFRVFLPTEEGDRPLASNAGPARIERGSEHILLVDDQESVIQVERQMLEVLGYHVTSRLSAGEALENFSAEPRGFDLVVTDMSMPEMSGTVLARKILDIRQDIPVILLTGYAESMGRDQALALGIRELLMKPLRLKDFSVAVRRELDTPASPCG